MSEFQKLVVFMARMALYQKPWFSGICSDRMREIVTMPLGDAVCTLMADTAYWDSHWDSSSLLATSRNR
jgi:hypothetical protein